MSSGLTKYVVFLTWLLASQFVTAASDSRAERDDMFGFVATRDVHYMPMTDTGRLDPARTLDIYRPDIEEESPVIVYVHDGGWAFGDKKDVNLKPHFFTSKGYAFVSINHRLRWDFNVFDQIVDIVSVLQWINQHGKSFGIDASRIVLMGHGSGGHLVSLAATDKRFFGAEGMSLDNIKAVVSIDCNSYDITRQMKELGGFLERRQHQLIFGSDVNVWTTASPISHVASERSFPPFALMFDPESEASTLQAKGFAKALSESSVEVIMIPGSPDHSGQTDKLLGTAGNISTIALMAFLRAQI